MPSTSWRSHFLPSCSVAELQEIADGVTGFTLPTEPANLVYPGVLLGDAWVDLKKTFQFISFFIGYFWGISIGFLFGLPDRRHWVRTNWINLAWLTSSTSPRHRPSPSTRLQIWPTNIPNGKTGEPLADSSAQLRCGIQSVDLKLNSIEMNLKYFAFQAYYRHVGMEFLGIPAYDTITFNLSRYFYEAALFIDEALRSGGKLKMFSIYPEKSFAMTSRVVREHEFESIHWRRIDVIGCLFLLNPAKTCRHCIGPLSRGNLS